MSDKKKKEEEPVFPNFDPTRDLSMSSRPGRAKNGKGFIPISEWEIKQAQEKARSAHEAARILGVTYPTYKKYAKQYGIFEDLKNPTGIGITKGPGIVHGANHKIEDILDGKHPDYPVWRLKQRLLLGGYLEEKCSKCGFSERRITDHKVPLVLDFIDGDRTNHKFENLRVLCLNCSFLIQGNLTGPKKEYSY